MAGGPAEGSAPWFTSLSPEESGRPSKPRVLVVEDDSVNQKVAAWMPRKLGYPADVAANGSEALASLDGIRYAAVFMDCQMPGMDGYQATVEIRRREAGERHTPIIAMTASAMEGDRRRCLEAGMDDHISKPMRSQAVAEVLERWVATIGDDPAIPDASRVMPASPEPAGGGPAGLDPDRWRALEELDRTSGGTVLHELVRIFLAETPDRLARLEELAGGPDRNQIRRIAHAMNGGSSIIGATRMHELCARIEDLAQSGGSLSEPVRQLATEFEDVRARLSDWTEEARP